MLFEDAEFELWGNRALVQAPFGGAEFGECLATAAAIEEGDRNSWKREWTRTGERVLAWAKTSSDAGHSVSASDAYLRASNYFRTATPFLYGAPVSDELRDLSARSNAAFARGLELGAHAAEQLEIPFEDNALPGWLVRADAGETRPLLICTNGYDSLTGEMWFAHGLAAVRRGYHVLLFDGPGQGAALMERGLFLRPDWEAVATAVVDHALTLSGIDEQRIAIVGWSLGGYLAPRAASGEPRIKAAIADPGLRGMIDAMQSGFGMLGLTTEQMTHLDRLPDGEVEGIAAKALEIPAMQWSLGQRGPMVHGADSAAGYLRTLPSYTLDGRIDLHPLPCPAHRRRGGRALEHRRGALRRAQLPQALRPVHRRRSRRGPLRDPGSHSLPADLPRLAGRDVCRAFLMPKAGLGSGLPCSRGNWTVFELLDAEV